MPIGARQPPLVVLSVQRRQQEVGLLTLGLFRRVTSRGAFTAPSYPGSLVPCAAHQQIFTRGRASRERPRLVRHSRGAAGQRRQVLTSSGRRLAGTSRTHP